ncbi:MAG: hypothetical protein ACKOOL_09375 [Novosphingobium sp.]
MANGTVLSVLMLAVLAMLGGAFMVWRQRGAVKQMWLMLVLALVMAANVAILLVPTGTGTTLAQQPR